MSKEDIIKEQKNICEKYNVDWADSPLDFKIGISKNIKSGAMPINGLRHNPSDSTAGWYIWAGGFSEEYDFFQPSHIFHLTEKYPELLKYLGLPPGYRFLIDNKGYEDVWFDEKLLEID